VSGSGRQIVDELAASFSLPVSTSQRATLDQFWRLLLVWNERINLTGARSVEQLLSDHLPDSFALNGLVPLGARVADVGAGGGLPALPFAILRPDAGLTLFEARAKRAAFLRTAVRELGIRSVVVAGRFEPAALTGERFDVAISRATFPDREWLALGRAAINPAGRVVVFTEAKLDGLAGARLVDSVQYSTGRGRSRRAAAYRFT
jgi:16S rRNA (guanine527-N7)-methyltransferase